MPVQTITFGCRLNSYESAAMQELENLPDNIIIINTCAVTGEAERQCRQTIRKTRRENPNAYLVVTGCAAQVHPEIYAQMPEVDRVLGNREKLHADSFSKQAATVLVSDINEPAEYEVPEPVFFEGRNRAFIQIQQGCDNHCTFCIVPQARGKSSYLEADKILSYARTLTDKGFSEIGLTGVDITDYPNFAGLIEEIVKTKGLKRLRLGSIDPACVSADMINLFAKSDVLMPHMHLSAQSGDNMILKRMARRHTREDILKLCQDLRAVRSDMVFGADFITGFPTETDAMFENTVDLVKQANLTHLHVFPYSERSGTPAAKMPQVPVPVRKERARILRETGDQILLSYMTQRIGSKAVVLMETEQKGLCEHYLGVKINTTLSAGDYVEVRLSSVASDGTFEGSVL